MHEFKVLRLGVTEYDKSLNLQLDLLEKRQNNLIPDTLILLEHPPTLTVGRRGKEKNLLVSEQYLSDKGIHFQEISRGGDITYHGPGQLVGYPIMDLNTLNKDVHLYLRLLEDFLIYLLKDYGINAARFKGVTGVWTHAKKIASIGIGVKRWVTYHGFALNVNNDLSNFDIIIPCGLDKVQMTSMKKEINSEVINL
jgi:lipoate-protein ligase B